jgi:hypothetical protein
LGEVAAADAFFYGRDESGARPSLNAGQIRQAREFCAKCPVIEECLTQALTNRERYGVWGGTTGRFRRQIFVLLDEGFMDLESAIKECLCRLVRREPDDDDEL